MEAKKRRKLPKTDLSERALRIFLQHYYSADWVRTFLFEHRFRSIFTNVVPKTGDKQKEDDLLLCLKASSQLFPTARGLKEIDNIVALFSRPSSSYESSDCRFAIFNKAFCSDTRYRMSLLTLADNAREYGIDTLASLWVIAATAKLDHVSAWQAYAAAKEQESRLLNYKGEIRYWAEQKAYVGDIKEKKFEERLLLMQKLQEREAKELELRIYLEQRAGKQLSDLLTACDLNSVDCQILWCTARAIDPGRHVANSLWTLGGHLLTMPQFAAVAKEVIVNALEYEDTAKELSSRITAYRRNCRKTVVHSHRWNTVSALFEEALGKLKSLLHVQEDWANDTLTLSQSMNKLTQSIFQIKKAFCGSTSSYLTPIIQAPNFDTQVKELANLLPVLTKHQYSFPELQTLLQSVCDNAQEGIDKYLKTCETIVRCLLELKNPSDELLIQYRMLWQESQNWEFLLIDYRNFITKFEMILERQPPLYDQIKEELYIKLIRFFADSLHSIHSNNIYDGRSWSDKYVRSGFFYRADEMFRFAARASSGDINTDINSQLLDLSFKIINLNKTQNSKDCKELQMAYKAKAIFEEAIITVGDSRLTLIKLGQDYVEVARLLQRKTEVQRMESENEREENVVTGEEPERPSTLLSQLYSSAAECLQQALGTKAQHFRKKEKLHRKALKYMEAIKAFEEGDIPLAVKLESKL